MSSPRVGKVADRIHQIIAARLEKGLRDQRLGFVTITEVRVTGDLQQASVFYTVYGSDKERRDSEIALRKATGLFRSEVAKNLGTRLTPTIEFIPDQLPDTAAHLTGLLAQAKAHDEAVRQLAAGAQYAGDADPYTKQSAPAEADSSAPETAGVDAIAETDAAAEPDTSARFTE